MKPKFKPGDIVIKQYSKEEYYLAMVRGVAVYKDRISYLLSNDRESTEDTLSLYQEPVIELEDVNFV